MTTKQTNRNIALKVLNIVDELNLLVTYRSYSVIRIALLSLKEHRSRDKRGHREYFVSGLQPAHSICILLELVINPSLHKEYTRMKFVLFEDIQADRQLNSLTT